MMKNIGIVIPSHLIKMKSLMQYLIVNQQFHLVTLIIATLQNITTLTKQNEKSDI